MLPVTYFVLVPNYIQYRIDTLDPKLITLYSFAVNGFTADGITFALNASIPALMPLAVKSAMGPFTINVHDSENQRMLNLDIPYVEFMLNEPLRLDFSGKIHMQGTNQTAAANNLAALASPGGIKDATLEAKMGVPIYAIGIKIYPSLQLHKTMKFGDFKVDLAAMGSLIPPMVKLNIDAGTLSRFGSRLIFSQRTQSAFR